MWSAWNKFISKRIVNTKPLDDYGTEKLGSKGSMESQLYKNKCGLVKQG